MQGLDPQRWLSLCLSAVLRLCITLRESLAPCCLGLVSLVLQPIFSVTLGLLINNKYCSMGVVTLLTYSLHVHVKLHVADNYLI